MELNMTNRTKLTLFYFLAIIPFIPINYVSYNFHVWSKTCEVVRILLLVFFAARMIKGHKKPSVPLTLAIIYFLGCAVSTFLAGVRFSTLLDGGVYLFGLTLLIEDGVSRDVDAMIDGMLPWFEIVIYANLLYYLLYSTGHLPHSGYVYDNIFSNHNAVVRKVLPGIVLGALQAFRTKKRITLRFVCMWLVLTFFLLRVRSMTATIGMIIFLAAILWHEFTKKSGIFKYEYFIILSGWLSIQFAVLRKFSFAQVFITKVLRKSMNLSKRTFLWARTAKRICERPFFGYGQLTHRSATRLIGATGPHNILLGTLFYGGILGLIILILMLIVFGRKIYSDRKQNRPLLFIFEAGLCAIFVMWNFEKFTHIGEFYRIYAIFVMTYYCEKFSCAS